MKFIAFEKVPRYCIIPDVWLFIGTYMEFPCIRFRLPLFVLTSKSDIYRDSFIFGWFVPSFAFLFINEGTKSLINLTFHSDFMGEPIESEERIIKW